MRESRVGVVLTTRHVCRRFAAPLVSMLLLAGALVLPAGASAAPELVTAATDGGAANGDSWFPWHQALSTDGDHAVFTSEAANLVADDTSIREVFVRDRAKGETIRVAARADGGEANGMSWAPAISGDGRWVVFTTMATDLPGISLGGHSYDLVARDLSKAPDEAGAYRAVALDYAAGASEPALSYDGSVVAFDTRLDLLPAADDDGMSDVYVRDFTKGGPLELISTEVPTKHADTPQIDGAGNRIAFLTEEPLAGASDANRAPDVYVKDRTAGTYQRGTLGAGGVEPAYGVWIGYAFSADGNHVAYTAATAEVPEDTNNGWDVFVRDLAAGTVARVSVGGTNRQTYGGADNPTISDNGQVVGMQSSGTDIVPGREGPVVRLRDRARTIGTADGDDWAIVNGAGDVFGYQRADRSGGLTVTNLYVETIEASPDTTAPDLTVPPSMAVAARSMSGARVSFTERASDAGGSGLIGTDCTPASGTVFPLGTTTVRCVAADGAGNETAKSFEVEVADVRAPKIAVPEQQTLVAKTGATAIWAGGITAQDEVDPYVEATCNRPDNAELPIGTTEITCTAKDLAGNEATATFPVVVVGQPAVDDAVASDVTVAEATRRVTVQLTLPAAVTADTELKVVTQDGSAKHPSDFDGKTDETTLVEAGTRTTTSTVSLRDDDRAEDTETFTLRFTGTAGGKTVNASATVTVLDGDAPHPDRRRAATGPVVFVNNDGNLLLALDPGETEPRVLAKARTGRFEDPQVSPDGTQVAYSDGSRIWVRPLEGGRATMIGAGVEASLQRPVWRPDGEAIAFLSGGYSDTGVVWIQSTDFDRQPETFLLPGESGGRLSWNPEGTQLAYTYAEPWFGGWQVSDIAIVDADTGETVKRFETPSLDQDAEWSHDGKFIVFKRADRRTDIPDSLYRPSYIAKLDVASGTVTPLSEEVNHGRIFGASAYGPPSISPDDKEVVFDDLDNDLDPDNPDPAKRRHYSFSVVPTDGSMVERDLWDYTDFAKDHPEYMPSTGSMDWAPAAADGATDEGRVLFTRASTGTTRLLSAKPTGEDVRVVAETGDVNESPAVAADGTWAAFRSTRDDAGGEIYVSTPGGRAVERLTSNTAVDGDPAVSADGSLVAFVRGTGTDRSIWIHDRARGTESRLVSAGAAGVAAPTFAPSGDKLAYVAGPGSSDPQIRTVGLDGAGDRALVAGSAPAFAPDGKHLAFTREVDGASQVYVGDADGAGAERVTSEPQGATDPTWGDDRSIAYATSSGIVRALHDGTRAELVTTPATGVADTQPAWATPYAKPGLQVDDVRVTEGTGTGASAVFSLALARPIDESVTVSAATADGTAKQPKDYVQRGSEVVTIPAGQTSVAFAVQVAGDAMDEPDEAFSVTLSGATDATITRATGTATIDDDDAPPTLTVTDVSQAEGDLGKTDAVFTLTLSAESGWTVGARAATAHGTTDGDDLTATAVDVSWVPGETVKTVRVPIHGDTQQEEDETYALELSAQSHVTGPARAATGTIVNDDVSGKEPETGITGDPAPLIATPTPTFTFIGSVPRGRFDCRVDGGDWALCTTPHRIRAVKDGEHTFEVRALDGSLVDRSPAKHVFTVDTLAPSTTILTGPRRVTNDATPVFTMSTDDSAARIECRLDGTAWATCGTRFQSPRLDDGEHTFAARAVDPAGNVDATPAALSFRVDTTAPESAWGTKLAPPPVTPTSSSAALDLGAGGAGTPEFALDAQGVAEIPVSCSAAAAVPCTGDVTVTETGAAAAKSVATVGATRDGATATRSAAGDLLARVSYTVPAGTTTQVALRLLDSARHKIERKGLVTAQAVVRTTDGGAAPAVPIKLTADPTAPRLLSAGARVRLTGGNRRASVRVKCPTKPGPGQKTSACSGRLELRIPPVGGAGKALVMRTSLKGRTGKTVSVRFVLSAAAQKRVTKAKRKVTAATLRAVWGTPAQAKTADLTLVRGASK